MADDKSYRNPARVRLTVACIYLTTYKKANDQGLIAKAREVLDNHNLELDVWPDNGQKFAFNTLDYGDDYIPDQPDAYRALRKAVDAKIRAAGCTFVIPMPAVFAQYKSSGYGISPPSFKTVSRGCLISMSVNNDKTTLVHEMGHCADCDHAYGDANAGNIMYEAEPRSFFWREQVEKLAKAAYAVG